MSDMNILKHPLVGGFLVSEHPLIKTRGFYVLINI